MERAKKEEIAMFRFGVISSLTSIRKTEYGEREKRIREITTSEWKIPGSRRNYISRSTLLEWLKSYEESGCKLESLYPKSRQDKGLIKSMDIDMQTGILNLKKEFRGASVSVLLEIAKERGIIPIGKKVSLASIYRLLNNHGAFEEEIKADRRKYEAEIPNDLWQADTMYGPYIEVNGKKKRTYLIAIIDDHSRLITHAEFYFNDTTDNFVDCLEKALRKRGLPRKIYTDNGSSFSSSHLKFITASLGIALVKAKPYQPQGKGKIERWFKTVRMKFLSRLKLVRNLEELNASLTEWIDKNYHIEKHSGICCCPLERYTKQLHLVRSIPKDLTSHFRINAKRKVARDRSISLGGNLYEAPIGLIGKTVNLKFHKNEPEKIEVFYADKSYGDLRPVDVNVNYRIGRIESSRRKEEADRTDTPKENKEYRGGELF